MSVNDTKSKYKVKDSETILRTLSNCIQTLGCTQGEAEFFLKFTELRRGSTSDCGFIYFENKETNSLFVIRCVFRNFKFSSIYLNVVPLEKVESYRKEEYLNQWVDYYKQKALEYGDFKEPLVNNSKITLYKISDYDFEIKRDPANRGVLFIIARHLKDFSTAGLTPNNTNYYPNQLKNSPEIPIIPNAFRPELQEQPNLFAKQTSVKKLDWDKLESTAEYPRSKFNLSENKTNFNEIEDNDEFVVVNPRSNSLTKPENRATAINQSNPTTQNKKKKNKNNLKNQELNSLFSTPEKGNKSKPKAGLKKKAGQQSLFPTSNDLNKISVTMIQNNAASVSKPKAKSSPKPAGLKTGSASAERTERKVTKDKYVSSSFLRPFSIGSPIMETTTDVTPEPEDLETRTRTSIVPKMRPIENAERYFEPEEIQEHPNIFDLAQEYNAKIEEEKSYREDSYRGESYREEPRSYSERFAPTQPKQNTSSLWSQFDTARDTRPATELPEVPVKPFQLVKPLEIPEFEPIADPSASKKNVDYELDLVAPSVYKPSANEETAPRSESVREERQLEMFTNFNQSYDKVAGVTPLEETSSLSFQQLSEIGNRALENTTNLAFNFGSSNNKKDAYEDTSYNKTDWDLNYENTSRKSEPPVFNYAEMSNGNSSYVSGSAQISKPKSRVRKKYDMPSVPTSPEYRSFEAMLDEANDGRAEPSLEETSSFDLDAFLAYRSETANNKVVNTGYINITPEAQPDINFGFEDTEDSEVPVFKTPQMLMEEERQREELARTGTYDFGNLINASLKEIKRR